MLEFSPQSIAALGYVDESPRAGFVRWWNATGQLLPRDAPELDALLAQAMQVAPAIGAEDNAEERLYLLAVATWLVPDPSVEAFLMMTDVLFEHRSTRERLERLIVLARPAGR